MVTGIRWTRVVIAAVGSEAGVIIVLLAAIAIYKRVVTGDRSHVDNQSLGERLGYYVAPTAGAITTFVMAVWAARGVDARYVANGVWVGIVSVVLTLGFALTARREHRFMYGIAFAMRIVAGALGGFVVQQLL